MNQLLICTKHNSPFILQDQAQGNKCIICLQQRMQLIDDNTYQEFLSFISKMNTKTEQFQNQLQQLLDKLMISKSILNYQINKIMEILMQEIKYVQSNVDKIYQMNPLNQTLSDLKNEWFKHEKGVAEFNNIVLEQIEKFSSSFAQTSREFKILMINNTQNNKYYEQQQYEFVLQQRVNEPKECRDFVINKESNLLIGACGKQIVVYEFIENWITKQITRIDAHADKVTALNFLNLTSFVSGGKDNLIIIWELEKNNNWIAKFKLNDHSNSVNCIAIDQTQLISGSSDKTIKFWIQEAGWFGKKYIVQQTIKSSEVIVDLCLNEKNNKLISCGEKQIFIMEKDMKNYWNINQTINLINCGLKVLFLNEHSFILQLEKNINRKQFLKDQQQINIDKTILDSNEFCQFIKQLNILVIKNGQFLNLYKLNEDNSNWRQIQKIHLEELQNSLVRISQDGQTLITWNSNSKEIKVRRIQSQG